MIILRKTFSRRICLLARMLMHETQLQVITRLEK